MSNSSTEKTSRYLAVRIGCAGWSLPAQYKAHFPAAANVLQRYALVFNAVEINSSFYRPHKLDTYARWADSVDDDFLFSVKIPRTITHDRHLKGVASELKTFLSQCSGLGARLGGLLVQLPPGLVFNSRSAKAFFDRLRGQLATGVAIACEPRHPSWFGPAAEGLWHAYTVNRVGADPAVIAANPDPGDAGRWQYWRLHGSPRMYYSSYTSEVMTGIARKVAAVPHSITPWIIFDNTAAGHATGNALAMRELLQDSCKPGETCA